MGRSRFAAYARCESAGTAAATWDDRDAEGLATARARCALLQHAFREFYARGIKRATLGVDSENESGATRLYERAGMHVESERVSFEKELE